MQTLSAKVTLRETPMVILTNSITSVSARILHSRNCPGLSIWATVTTPFCIGWENIQLLTAVSSMTKSPVTGKTGSRCSPTRN